MIALFAHVYQIQLVIHKRAAMPSVSSIQIVQDKKHVSTNAVKIHVNQRPAVSMQTVASMITQLIVIVKTVLWETLLFIVYQIHRLQILRPIHATLHHVQSEAYAMFMATVLLFVMFAPTNSAIIIHLAGQNV